MLQVLNLSNANIAAGARQAAALRGPEAEERRLGAALRACPTRQLTLLNLRGCA